MYEEYFGMSKTPFVRNIPADLLYESSSMKDGLGRLKYAADRQLFAVVCSPAGCGKSTLLRKFNDTLSKDKYLVLYISDSKLTPKWLYRSLLDQLGIESSFYRGDSKRLLQKQIEIIREKEKRKVVCILDEAHLLEKETPDECVQREFTEETGLTLLDYKLRGLVTFISDEYETVQMWLYTASKFEGKLKPCDEGELHWIDIDNIPSLNLWERLPKRNRT